MSVHDIPDNVTELINHFLPLAAAWYAARSAERAGKAADRATTACTYPTCGHACQSQKE